MVKFIHAADFHLDAPFSALPAQQAAARREELRGLPHRLSELARQEKADLVLLSGDLFDGEKVYRETLETLAKALGEMEARVFIAPGNHDPYALRSPWTGVLWPDNVHIFTSPAIEAVELPALGCTVYGGAFTAPCREDSPLEHFHAPRDGREHIMVLHGDVDGSGRYCPIPSAQIAGSGLTYLALGHVHARSALERAGETCWAYPGCPEGRGFDETGDKGVYVGSCREGKVEVSFRRMCRRRYQELEVDLTQASSAAEALLAALPQGTEEDIYRILLTGEWGPEEPDLEALTALAAPRFYSLSLRDRTRQRRDLWSRTEEDTLTGLFLRAMKERLDAAGTEEDRALVEKAVRFGLAALEDREEPMA